MIRKRKTTNDACMLPSKIILGHCFVTLAVKQGHSSVTRWRVRCDERLPCLRSIPLKQRLSSLSVVSTVLSITDNVAMLETQRVNVIWVCFVTPTSLEIYLIQSLHLVECSSTW